MGPRASSLKKKKKEKRWQWLEQRTCVAGDVQKKKKQSE